MKIKPIVWLPKNPTTPGIIHSRVVGISPFGKFLITWKSWEENPAFVIEESPCIDNDGTYKTLGEAKAAAQLLFECTIGQCIEN